LDTSAGSAGKIIKMMTVRAGAREEVSRIEGQQLMHRVCRHVALHDEDDQAGQKAQDAGRAPLTQVLCPASKQGLNVRAVTATNLDRHKF
jgi:hypothetical protein